jgi:aryl-alcohol dehydrogenase-like predicted oxidoreductase
MPVESSSDMPTRTLGRTGEQVSAIGLGGWHLALKHVDVALAIRIVHAAIDRGITFMDNCWDYNDGDSERRMGKALADGRRERVFLMTKIDGRTAKAATAQLDESLRRLKTDHVDLVQHHEVLRFDDADRMFEEDGAHAALEDARKAGKVRFIGFTGHKNPQIHLHTIDVARQHGVTFDTVQMPLNVMDAHFRSFERLVLPELVREQVGVLGMKPLANGRILQSNTVSAIECLHYALHLPTSVVITGCDSMAILDQAVDAARTFRPMDDETVRALLARTAAAAATGEYELFKTTSIYDSTAQHADWLGEEPQRWQDTVPA